MALIQYKTPGVYVEEFDAFPPSIVGVETAVPAFIGYTEKAEHHGRSVAFQPVRIGSMAEYVSIFGGACDYRFTIEPAATAAESTVNIGGKPYRLRPHQNFCFYNCLRLFYANGGDACYIVSAGSYSDAVSVQALTSGLDAVRNLVGPTMLVIPEAVVLQDTGDDTSPQYDALVQAMLKQCYEKEDRVAILDVWGTDSIESFNRRVDNFRSHTVSGLGPQYLRYGMAYAPYLHTAIVDAAELSLANLDAQSQTLLQGADVPALKDVYAAMAAKLSTLPPSAAMAGVYTRNDATRGVWNAPANVGLTAVTGPAVAISNKMQYDLNMPTSGLAINAIRDFVGRGTLVWGARTLDGNSNDWRYIQVRRALIYIEQSVKLALTKFVFEPNVAQTWVTVASMTGSFLRGVWQAGGLMGASPQEAFSVHCGLGSTMTAQDILEGRLIVQIMVTMVHPAEFIILTLQQQMQGSA